MKEERDKVTMTPPQNSMWLHKKTSKSQIKD
jgi:hypothetical protein